ncbi:MAG: hypothetical protein RLZZ262_732 [Bacteroidota bacterium]|jgi:UDP-GlcNAc:undecaprenyl-phosphate/decaprenyl-phosphate GlcNAc-1-phosphate transferase
MQTLFTLLVALFSAYCCLKLVIFLYVRFNWLDKPGARKNHAKPVPAAGGVAIFLTFFVTALCVPSIRATFADKAPVLFTTSALVMIGAVDDRFNLSSIVRLFLQIACAFVIAHFYVRIESLHGILGIGQLEVWMQYGLTIFILVGIINAYNMMDGIDGLAGAFSSVIIGVLLYLGYWLGMSNWNSILLVFLVAIAMFLKFNWRPASIFMGDSGSMPLGFLFAVISLDCLSYASTPEKAHLVLVAITGVFLVPVMDTLRLFKYRISKGRSPFSADRNHLHHWLLRNKMAHSNATIRIVILQFCLLIAGYVAIQWMPVSWVVLIQAILVFLFTYVSKRLASFFKWYGIIRRMEMSDLR